MGITIKQMNKAFTLGLVQAISNAVSLEDIFDGAYTINGDIEGDLTINQYGLGLNGTGYLHMVESRSLENGEI